MEDRCGFQKLTASGVVNTSGRAIAVYGLNIQSGTEGAGTATLYDGTSTGGTAVGKITGLTNDWLTNPIDYSVGRVFRSGLYIDIDSNTTSVVVWYQTIP